MKFLIIGGDLVLIWCQQYEVLEKKVKLYIYLFVWLQKFDELLDIVMFKRVILYIDDQSVVRIGQKM